MFNLGGGEILVILIVALLVLGPDKLPKFMRTVGKAVGDLRRASTDFQRTMNLEIAENESASAKNEPAPAENESASKEAKPEDPDLPAVQKTPPSSRPTPKLRAIPSRRGSRPTARR